MSPTTISVALYNNLARLRRENDDLKAQLDTARIEANKIVMQLSETNREYGALEAERDELERVAAPREWCWDNFDNSRRWSAAWKAAAKEKRWQFRNSQEWECYFAKQRNDARRWSAAWKAAAKKYKSRALTFSKLYRMALDERDDATTDEWACAINEIHRLRGFIAKVEAERDELDRGFDGLAAARDYLADRVLEMQGYKPGSHTTGTSSKSYTVPGTVNAGDPLVECVRDPLPTIDHDWVWEHGAETWLWEGEDE